MRTKDITFEAIEKANYEEVVSMLYNISSYREEICGPIEQLAEKRQALLDRRTKLKTLQNNLEVDELFMILDCMLYSLCQAHDSCINVIFELNSDHDVVNQVYYIINNIYRLMEVSGVKPEHYKAILSECRWYSDSAWQMYCDFAGYTVK